MLEAFGGTMAQNRTVTKVEEGVCQGCGGT